VRKEGCKRINKDNLVKDMIVPFALCHRDHSTLLQKICLDACCHLCVCVETLYQWGEGKKQKDTKEKLLEASN
jgi:hypothetical protein